MPFMRLNMQFPKLTTAATLAFGHLAKRNVIEVTEEQLDAYLSRRPFFPTPGQLTEDASTGYVVLTFEGITVGLGLFYTATDERGGKVESLYPKSQANRADRSAVGQEESGDA
jgi:NOL1/NOP2/fmu family ribosome biogenesis protein